MKNIFRMHFSLFCLLLILTASTGSVWANVAANTQIINTATLSYNDGTGVKTIPASVTVKVALVPAQPNIALGSNQSTAYTGPTTPLTNTFTVTATANGPDTYNITSAITASTNTSGATVTPQVSSVYLGATVTATGSTATVLVVPADGVSDGKVNGIAVGSTVVVGADPTPHTVSAVSDNAAGTSTITLAPALSPAPGAGILVAEQKPVLVNVTSGTVTTPGSNVTVSKNVTLTSATNSGVSVTSGAITDTYTSSAPPIVAFAKYVRNVTTPASGTGTKHNYISNDYYEAGTSGNNVTAKPGEILEYILVANNTGAGAVTSSVVTDVLPTAYVALNPGAYGASKEVTYVDDSGASTTYSAAADGDNATYVPGTSKLTVYVGTGATSSAGGSIPGGNKTVLVLYQVKVN